MLYKSILAENFKIRRNLMFLTLCFFPFAISLILFIHYLFANIPYMDFWAFSAKDSFLFYVMLYPTILSFVAFVYVNLEIKNNCIKQLFYLPIKPYKIYLAKCTVLFYYYTISIAIAYISYMLNIYFLDMFVPEISANIQHYDTKPLIDTLFLKTYIILLPVVFFQFMMSLAIPKVWFPSTTSLFLTIGGMMIYRESYSYVLPHASLNKLIFSDFTYSNIDFFDKAFYVSIIYSILFIVIGYFVFKTTKSKIDS